MTGLPALNTIETVLLERLRTRGGDVTILSLYAAAYGVTYRDAPSTRSMQMRLGPRITGLNRKLAPGERVIPGRMKRTYRLELLPLPPSETSPDAA